MHSATRRRIAWIVTTVWVALLAGRVAESKTLYVSPSGSNSNSGLTWAAAKASVQAALGAAVSGDQVWVSAGTYLSTYSGHFSVPAGVALYGGFFGHETDPAQRDWNANATILDGGAYGSVVSLSGTTAGTRIDGFTIRNGAAGEMGGGAVRCVNGSTAIIANNTLIGNSAAAGGGIACFSSSPTIVNNRIVGNSAAVGGGIHCENSPSAIIANNTIVFNEAGPMGGGILCLSPVSISNNIVAFNSSGIRVISTGEPLLRGNCVYANTCGGYLGLADPTGSGGNVSADPRLADLRYANLHIQPDSPCRDAGANDAVAPGSLDMDMQARIQGERVDIGADESDGTTWATSPHAIVRVSTDGDDANDGTSWSVAKRSVQAGIQAASASGGEVWVAGGTYHEDITLRRNVHLYGGFAGTETLRAERDWARHRTVLQAASYASVVVAKDIGARLSTIDGFTIRGGSVTEIATRYYAGGGILCWRASPCIANCTLTCNGTTYAGGGISCLDSASPQILNCVVAANSKIGIGCIGSSPTVINCTVCNNGGPATGSGISVAPFIRLPSSPAIVNTIVAMNSSGLLITSPGPSYCLVRHNCVYGNRVNDYSYVPDLTGIDGNISADPLLAAAEYGNVHLQPGSPCRDAGDDAFVEAATLDMDAGPRVQGGHVDIGADESVGTPWPTEPNVIVRVSMSGSDDHDGSSWALAKRTVQAALDAASAEGGQVWVEAGTYAERITLPAYAQLYGGFAGNESTLTQRNWHAHPVILESASVLGVVTSRMGYRVSSVDGFTIRNGWNGIHCDSGSPVIAHNVITGNSGSGVFCDSSSPILSSNNITANGSAGVCGDYDCALSLINNTITANVGEEGAGINSAAYALTAVNNLVAFNSSGVLHTGTTEPDKLVIRHNCVYGNMGYQYSGIADPTGIDGNISVDPRFVRRTAPVPDGQTGTPDDVPGDWRLQISSPCIDAGDNAAVPAGLSIDLSGRPRRVDAPATTDTGTGLPPMTDIGAYEYQPTANADFNDDGQVDLVDLEAFLACGTGPSLPYDPTRLPALGGCTLWPGVGSIIPADFDADGDVDQEDFGVMQRCYGQADNAASACHN